MKRCFALSLVPLSALVVLTSLAGCNERPSNPNGGAGTGIAVLSSDNQTATVISLVDPAAATVTVERCFDSNSTPAGTSAALSGDVVLPSSPQPAHELLVVDRANAALTWLDPATCTVLRQLSVGKGFAANPQDVIAVSASKAYVPRYGRNATPSADVTDFDEGDDLLIIDPSQPRVLGSVDLQAHKAPVDGNSNIEARPTRGVLLGGRVYVTLDSMARDYSAQGEARLVVIAPSNDSVETVIHLTGLKNCSSPAPSMDGKALLVPCAGSYADVDQVAGSGLAVVDVTLPTPALSRVLPAATFGGRSLSVGFVSVAGPKLAFAAAMGAMAFGGSPAVNDSLWAFDPAGGAGTSVLQAAAFTLGSAVFDAGTQRLLVPVAEPQASRLALIANGAETGALTPTAAMPPRAAAWY